MAVIMSGEIRPINEELIAERVKYWKSEIIRCLQSPTLISQLAAHNIINEGKYDFKTFRSSSHICFVNTRCPYDYD